MARASKASSHPLSSQPVISSFFTQSTTSGSSPRKGRTMRSNSPIDLTMSDDDANEDLMERPAKRRKMVYADEPPSLHMAEKVINNHSSRRDLSVVGTAERYSFNNSIPDKGEDPSDPREREERIRRREKAKKILLVDEKLFVHDDGVQYELGSDDDADDNETLPKEVAQTADRERSDSQFDELMTMFKNPTSRIGARTKSGNAAKAKSKKSQEIGPSGLPYTPLELQILEMKKKYPGTILMFEVGYKFRFFGEDAPIAAKELGIVAFQHRNFLTASIPVHRRDVHLKKLLSRGHKVGIVEQTETAALKKAGDTRNDLFARKLTQLYTATTYVDALNSADENGAISAPPLVCLVEDLQGGMGEDERVCISMIAVSPSTGDVVWDQFEDNHMRTELETRMVHTMPSELLLPEKGLSKPTEKMLKYFTTHSMAEHKTRIERFKHSMSYTEAFSYLSRFYTDKTKSSVASESFNSGQLMASISNFPKQVVVALARAVQYLSDFDIADVLLETRFFSKFTERTHMLLNGNTLTNLEIYRNETDFSKKGSLIWILDHTTTKFGARMLRSWVGRPLTDTSALSERTDAIEEILSTHSAHLTTLRTVLKNSPDLARGLCRIQYGKCTPPELVTFLTALSKIASAFPLVDNVDAAGFKSPILNGVLYTLPKLRKPVEELLNVVNLQKAREGKKEAMWTDVDKYPDIDAYAMNIQVVESELMDELKTIRKIVKKPSLQYTTWSTEEYVVEIRKDENREIPVDWILLSSTKTVRRYHPPAVKEKLLQRAQWQEALESAAKEAYQSFLQEISHKYYALFRDAINKLAVADCLLSLALVSVQEGYVRPEFVESDEDILEIVDGRHPMVETLRNEPFIPNSITMGDGEPRSKIITGPNMGGKSSVVKMVALCTIMAQIGSYVPAASMKLSMVDGILVRMGASDELVRGRSTFMVEMQETSEILQLATRKTLVILDELGRGTSTFDGMAVASAVLQHLVQNIKCKTLFITHYPQVANDLERRFPDDLENLHMGFTEDTRIDGTREVTFLYKLSEGLSKESFGVECARLAGIPESILRLASARAHSMKGLVESRVNKSRLRKCLQLLRNPANPRDALQELRELLI
ncbi:hypothetical protein K474DRAFT_1668569 [Panus rudis PR-1116 ss-1]|nr:hypothetical protein K474DRAFT_1668569 [Panus rudis PR-1116 ss-1]